MSEPRKSHLMATKRILIHLNGTMSLGLLFPAIVKEKKV